MYACRFAQTLNGVERWVDAMDAVADEVDLFDMFRADIPLPS